jgi:hypothetical protein
MERIHPPYHYVDVDSAAVRVSEIVEPQEMAWNPPNKSPLTVFRMCLDLPPAVSSLLDGTKESVP